ncbi:SDR family NAD(P)-dependent oxidoreductase [Acanthopleuribacter pedis]
MDLGLKGKLALVTASSGGIGEAIARVLAGEGVRVIVSGRSQESVEKAQTRIRNAVSNADLLSLVGDLGTAAGAEVAIAAFPDVDILVNNLGIYEAKPFAEIPDEDWQRLFDINVMSGVRLSRHYLPRMIERNSGRIIFISSESGVQIPPEMVHYGMTKSCQLAIARGMSEWTKGTKVTVNTVMPGPTLTEGVEAFIAGMDEAGAADEAAQRRFIQTHRNTSLTQRLGDPVEIGATVAFLASQWAGSTNGAAVRAEGGLLRSLV